MTDPLLATIPGATAPLPHPLPNPNETTDTDDAAAAVALKPEDDIDICPTESPNLPGPDAPASTRAKPAANSAPVGSESNFPPSSGEGKGGVQTLEPLPPIDPNETKRARARRHQKENLEYDAWFECDRWETAGGNPMSRFCCTGGMPEKGTWDMAAPGNLGGTEVGFGSLRTCCLECEFFFFTSLAMEEKGEVLLEKLEKREKN